MATEGENVNWTDLAQEVCRGRAGVAEEMADRLTDLAYRYFRRAGLSREDSEDLTQESVWHVVLHLPQFRGDSFVGWAKTVFRHRMIDAARRRRPPLVPLQDSDSMTPEPEAQAGIRDRAARRAIEEALAAMPSEDREILEARHSRSEIPYEDIGRALGMTPGAARVRYLRARRKLKTVLDHDPRIQAWLVRQPEATARGERQ